MVKTVVADPGGRIDPPDDGLYEFGPFHLDARDRLLRREGTTVPLEPVQFQALAVLLREAGHLVTREHLMTAVWRETYVDEGSLTVTISMLRRKLGDTPSHPRYIETVRKAGYRFVAPVTRHSPRAGTSPIGAASVAASPARTGIEQIDAANGHWTMGLAATAVLIVAIAGLFWPRSAAVRDPASAPVPLYPFGGTQDGPTFSPDGSQVAFTWRPPDSDNDDIYLLTIGDLQATRLTTDRKADMSPAWSPDGRQIAFIRRDGSAGEILLISPAGGTEQKVVDTAGTAVAWSPDSKTLAFNDRPPGEDAHSIFLVPAAGGAPRRVTFPAAEATHGDGSPAISPDGRLLAFVRHLTYDVADILVQPLDTMQARHVTFDKRQIRGFAWASGGRELIFSSNRNGRHQLWRVDVDTAVPPRPVEGVTEARSPAISRSRLVYQAFTEDYNVRIFERRTGIGSKAQERSVFANSIRDEQSPTVSPDGRRLAFVSDRSGWFEVWVCGFPAASDCRQRTSFRDGYVGSPRWSPDSQRLAFDARVGGNADIYLVRADGGQPVPLTRERSVEARPSWSGDGRYIYFRSDRTGAHQIWKMPVAGGTATQITRNGGFEAFEAPDGASLYFVQGRYTRGLWTLPVTGGAETRVPGFGSLTASGWAIVDDGILWIDPTASNPPGRIRHDDFSTRAVTTVADVPGYVIPTAIGFSAIRDGSVMAWSQLDRSAHDLMLVERFR
jgi:Tol biopolymer transport system component/DNA-binding winged helix-turn-helix (wHTH) protein